MKLLELVREDLHLINPRNLFIVILAVIGTYLLNETHEKLETPLIVLEGGLRRLGEWLELDFDHRLILAIYDFETVYRDIFLGSPLLLLGTAIYVSVTMDFITLDRMVRQDLVAPIGRVEYILSKMVVIALATGVVGYASFLSIFIYRLGLTHYAFAAPLYGTSIVVQGALLTLSGLIVFRNTILAIVYGIMMYQVYNFLIPIIFNLDMNLRGVAVLLFGGADLPELIAQQTIPAPLYVSIVHWIMAMAIVILNVSLAIIAFSKRDISR